MRTLLPFLLACLVPGLVLADDGDDTLRFYLSRSDVVVLGEFASELDAHTREAGVVHYGGTFRIDQLIKGKAQGERRVGGTIDVHVVRFESAPEDRLPELKKGGRCILFLKENKQPGSPCSTVDVWFGVQRPSPWMARSLARLAGEQAPAAPADEKGAQLHRLLGEPEKTKIDFDPLGYRTLRDPVGHWKAMKAEKRWTGKLADAIPWKQVERVHVLHLYIHVRDRKDVETYIRNSMESVTLLEQEPENAQLTADNGKGWFHVQALLQLTDGTPALVSIGSGSRWTWLIVEHRGRVGLGVVKRP
jgi:hypothetical protein